MSAKARNFRGFRSCAKHFVLNACVSLVFASSLLPALADGVFVFKWNKQIDINEPTQKAIIVYDGGREDLLLQVKYEGPLEEFGWLIPVPSIPTVEKGSMAAFYELSELTQRHFGYGRALTLSAAHKGAEEDAVKVIQIKTVGAYEVAILSARDSGSLDRWLRANDYSLPEGKADIVDEYIRKGWYFVAARIQLRNEVAFKTVTASSPKDTEAPDRARKILQRKLSSGELHPVLISFDTPTCVFPLKISAAGGKPSEVSLYVLSPDALLSPFMLDEALSKIDRERAKQERLKPERDRRRETSIRHLQALRFGAQMSSLDARRGATAQTERDWSVEDLIAMAKEDKSVSVSAELEEESYGWVAPLMECVPVSSEQIPQSTKTLSRLKDKTWYLTKCSRTFQPEEMRDLEFQPAIPVLARTLSGPSGAMAAGYLSQLGTNALAVLISACGSTNASERIHASAGLQSLRDPRVAEMLPTLFKDELPLVRYHALLAAPPNWDSRFVDPLLALFRDPYPQIAMQAAQCLILNESSNHVSVYLPLLKDSDANVQACALRVLFHINREAIPRADLLSLLGNSRLDTVSIALNLLQETDLSGRPAGMLGGDPWAERRIEKNWLASAEAAPLLTNSLTMARLMGLRVLQHNADAKAVELGLPLLRDTNSIVRNRAFALLRSVTGQELPQNDPAKWDEWWAKNRDTFKTARPPE